MRKLLRPKFLIIFGLLLIADIVVLLLGTIRVDKSVTLKGDTTPITSVVDVDKEYTEKGSFSSIYVVSVDRCTLLQSYLAQIDPVSDVEDLSTSISNISNADLIEINKHYMSSSINTALIVAYSRAKATDPTVVMDYTFQDLFVSYHNDNSPFQTGDLIIKCDGVSCFSDAEDFADKFNARSAGTVFTIKRGSKELDITLTDESKYSFNFIVEYYIDQDTIYPAYIQRHTNTGGPSGGLLQTLAIFNRLTDFDYTNGLAITGTGTINIDGRVGGIGGIVQKVYTAFDDKKDIFFCPEANYEEAYEAWSRIWGHERMKLVKVSTFSEAVNYLENIQ